MITLGDRGIEVSQLQKNLSLLGYDLIIDGYFGNITFRSLKAFQKKYNLPIDGIAVQKTLLTIKAAQKRTSKEQNENKYAKNYKDLNVDVSCKKYSEQFIRQTTNKDKIFIHNTMSGPDAKGVINNWSNNVDRVSSSFVISGRGLDDGKIYEAFNPDYWSYHLGVKGSKGKLDKSSIGIEICSWGPLEKKGNKFFNIYGGEVDLSEVYTLDCEWRGKIHFHSYSDKQIESLEKLLIWIISEYKINIQDDDFNLDWTTYNEKLISNNISGIWTHASVRKDKYDVYPDQRLFDMLNRINKK